MAKRGPGRPRADATTVAAVEILNGEVPPHNNKALSPRKRKRASAGEDAPNAKRRATEDPAEEVVERRTSTRLGRPKTTMEQHRPGGAGHRHDRHSWTVPTTPPPSSKAMKTMKRPTKTKPLPDEDNSQFDSDEGGVDTANPQMLSPAFNTRNFHKRISSVGQDKDGETVIVEVQPIKKAQRAQRMLGGTQTESNTLLKRRLASSQDVRNESIPSKSPEIQDSLAAGVSGNENGVQGSQPSITNALEEHQDQTSPREEPAESVAHQSLEDEPADAPQVSGTKRAFERASTLYDCKKVWKEMLEANGENLEDADEGNQSSEIREVCDLVKRAKLAYRVIRQAEVTDMRDKEYEIDELLADIDKVVGKIHPLTNKKQDALLIKGVYHQGIPKLVQLLKAALVSRSLDGELSIESLKELVKIIDTTVKLCMKAYCWYPRPELDYGVKRRTNRTVKLSLDALRRAYTEAQYDDPDEEEEKAQKAEKRRVLADHVAHFLAREEEKKKRAEDNKRKDAHDRIQRRLNEDRLQSKEFDIDELGLNGFSPSPAATGVRSNLPHRETGVIAARRSLSLKYPAQSNEGSIPRMSRERTEDIPGPMARQWSEDEDAVLLRGLQHFTGANRYLEIDEYFGSPGGPLSGRDVDELMQRARFYKQSLASHIQEEREGGGNVDKWAFLLSVEG